MIHQHVHIQIIDICIEFCFFYLNIALVLCVYYRRVENRLQVIFEDREFSSRQIKIIKKGRMLGHAEFNCALPSILPFLIIPVCP